MTQILVSEKLAASIQAHADSCHCTTEEYLESVIAEADANARWADALLTPELGARIAADLKRDRSEFMTSEEVDRKFEALFRELESK